MRLAICLYNLSGGDYNCTISEMTGVGESKEAVVQRCSVKKVFLQISQNSQENTCARVSF